MHRLVIADLTNQRLLRDLGGPAITFSKLPSKSTLRLALRFSEQVGGTHVERHPDIVELRASIGPVDLRPEAGQIKLKVGSGTATEGTNLTTALDWDFTAAELASALNALSVVGTAVVVEDDATFLITGIAETITIHTNTLRPITFARIETYEVGGTTTNALRLQRAPYAFTDSYTQKVPAGPSITRVQAGGEADGVEWNEIQKLTTPREFAGTYLIKANDEVARTGLLGVGDGPDEVALMLNPSDAGLGLAPDSGGLFIVTEHPTEPAMFLEFAGTMAGAGQDLLKVAVFDAPEGDFLIDLDLNTPATSEAFRDTDEVAAVLEIFADIQDPDDEELVHENVSVFRGPVAIVESIVHADLALPQNPDWINPPQAKSYVPVSPDSLTSGTRFVPFLLGNGADAAHQVTHSLDSPRVRIHLRENTAGGRDLVPGTDYEVEHDDDDAVTITFLGDYASPVPSANAISGTAQDLTTTSTWLTPLGIMIDDVDGLRTILDAYAAAIAALKAGNFGGSAPAISTTVTGKIDRPLPRIWRIPRARGVLPAEPESLSGWNPFGEGSTLRDIRLLPAVHATTIETLPTTLPATTSLLRGRVWVASTDRPTVAGGIVAGEHVANDGREWYQVRRESDSESTWYPVVFESKLWSLSISPDELALRTRLDIAAGIELRLFDPSRRPDDRRTVARMSLILERGVRTADTTPGTPGSNIADHFGSPVILGEHQFDLTDVPVQKTMSLSIARDGSGALTAHVGKMLGAMAVVSAPASADFVLRYRIGRVDFQNIPTDSKGVIAYRGLDVGLDGKPDPNLGRWRIA